MKIEQLDLFGRRDLQAYSHAIAKQDSKMEDSTLSMVILFEDEEINWKWEERDLRKAAHDYNYMKFEGMKESDMISWLSTRYKRKKIEIQLLLLYLEKRKDSR